MQFSELRFSPAQARLPPLSEHLEGSLPKLPSYVNPDHFPGDWGFLFPGVLKT